MTTTKTYALALTSLAAAISLNTGCAAEAPGNAGGDDTMDPGPTDDPEVPKDMTVTGRYAMSSTYDIATNMPGKAGEISNAFISATDDPDDPTNWMLEQMINAMPNGTAKTFLNSARGYVAGYLNDRILDWAPDFVTTMVQMGNDFGDITKHFGMIETLDITAGGIEGQYGATHTVTGVHLKLDSNEQDFLFADFGTADVKVEGVSVSVDQTGKLALGSHKVPMQYGTVMRIAMDGMIIPSIDPTASNLNDLFQHQIDCYVVGQYIADAIGFGSASTYNSACGLGINAGANFLYSKIADVDGSALEFGIAGAARVVDTNGDKAADKIQTGTWTGDLTYAGTPAPLGAASFRGERQ